MDKRVLTTIGRLKDEMFLAERKVADYIAENPNQAVEMNVSELAEKSGASDATVIRLCKRWGSKGFYQMKLALAEELGRYQMTGYTNPADNPQNAREVIQCLARDLLHIADMLDNEAAEQCADMICRAKRIFVVAAGNTIPVAMDFAFRLCRVGIEARCGTVVEYGMASMVSGSDQDLLIAISHSGISKHVLQAAEIATNKKMPIVAVTGSKSSPLAKRAELIFLTKIKQSLFGEYGPTTHIYDQAILDAILYLVAQKQKMTENIEMIESLLAEYKL